MRRFQVFLLTAALAAVTAAPVLAQEWRGRGDWRGYYHGYNSDHWRGGNWFNGFHDGRNGWWWIVDGGWYYYPAPIYPYPDPYTPPSAVVETPAAPPPDAAPATLYYCAEPAGYYPEVAQCPRPWQRIAAEAAAPPQPVPPPPDAHEIDRQQLGVFSARLQTIDPQAPHARAKLKDLGKQVEAFRQSLYTRDYNAMDVMRNAESLKQRIDDERKSLAAPHPGAPPAAAAPPANSLPPGTAVTFPPH